MMMSKNIMWLDKPWDNNDDLNYPHLNKVLYIGNGYCEVSKQGTMDDLIFFVTTKDIIKIDKSKKYKGFSTSMEISKTHTRLICKLNDSSLKKQFTTLARAVAKGTADMEGKFLIERASEIIKEWSNFFSPSRTGITREEYIGIWGELYILNNEILNIYDPEHAISFWTGALSKDSDLGKKDFTFNNIELEIKATMSGGSSDIYISSKDQLDKNTNNLYLLHLFLSESDENRGHSLQELYDSIVEKLSPDSSAELDFIDKVKYYMENSDINQLNNRLCYSKHNLYEVKDRFPCLNNKNVPPGITQVKYKISPSSLDKFLIKKSIKEIIQ
jgi:hypothetical protein